MRLVLSALLAAPALAGWSWHQTISPHFIVSHESAWMPPGMIQSLEKMHNRLRRDLAMLSPWISRERLNLYLYAKPESYLAGEFKPPAWSNGIAMHDKKIVAVYDQPDRKKLQAIISHETTHLLFEDFWSQSKKSPPSWLNEGLAMMEEAESEASPEKSEWYQAMAYLPKGSLFPMEDFLKISPSLDLADKKEQAGDWYVQAYSVTYFIYRQHPRMQFKNFCARMRDGGDLSEALRIVYRYSSLPKFEKAWRTWLQSPSHRARVDKQLGSPKTGAESLVPEFKMRKLSPISH